MCGIAGILTKRDELDLEPALTRMLHALRHRGPDDEGWEQVALPNGYRLGLVHTRLTIMDLSAAGHQPMTDPESGSWITYNGETYNHADVRRQLPGETFRSTGDTETVLTGWVRSGPQVLASLRGMFAFALYDARRRQVWLVRDRLGIKPLYAALVDDETCVFASELRALLASGLVARRLNRDAVESYLAFGAVTAPWTLLEGVRSLLPGEAWCFDLNRAAALRAPESTRYWRPPFEPSNGRGPSHQEAAEMLRPVLVEAVGLRMVADVPVAVFLSGGIDSSGVVAALASQGHHLRTFSVAFGEHQYDESEHARLIAQRFGTEHTELLLSPARVLNEFDTALAAYDQPSIDGVNTYFISQATRQAGVKVALSGLGGDELFGGYSYFRLSARLERRLPRAAAWLAHQVLRRIDPDGARTTKLGAVLNGARSPLARYAVLRQVMPPDRRDALLGCGEPHQGPLPPQVWQELDERTGGLDAVNAHSLLELSLYLANMLLRDTDQMSMAHALEVREPLLDHVLVETAARLPGPLKLTAGRQNATKALFVDALPEDLPPSMLRRPKMGFVFPWECWLRNELKGKIGELLVNQEALDAAGLRPGGVRNLWEAFLSSRPGVRYTDILSLAHLLDWVTRHGVEAPTPCPAAI
jgi:asparagine synthase (glutamine-hydrolysing)